MKIAEYNQMMAYLTRPKVRDVDFGLGDTNVESLVPDSKENFKYTPISKKKNRDPDIYEIQHELNKYRAKEDQLKEFDSMDRTTFPSDPIQQKKLKKIEKEESIFSDILKNVKVKPSKQRSKKPTKKVAKVDDDKQKPKPKPNGVDTDPPVNIIPFPFDRANEKPWYESNRDPMNDMTVEEYMLMKQKEYDAKATARALEVGIGKLFK